MVAADPSVAAADPRRSWEEPGAFPVAPGVHRIPLPLPNDGLRAVNVYAIQDDDGLVLVDAGWSLAHSQHQLARGLASLGYELGDVRRFLVTHIHRDHYTQAVAVRRVYGSRIALGLGEQPGLDMILSRPETIIPARVAYLLSCGAGPVVEALAANRPRGTGEAVTDWEKPDEWLTASPDAGLASRTLRVIPTPGHTQGHVVFLDERQRLLFAGDHVLPHITPSIGFETPVPPLPLGDFLTSLRLMLDYPDATLLPAHGPVAASTHERVRELLRHHAVRLDACAAILAEQDDSTAYEVALRLPWTRRGRGFAELGPFDQMLAVGESAAHLDVLVEAGRATKSTMDVVFRYQPT